MKHRELFDSLCCYFPGLVEIDPRTSPIMSLRNVSAEWIREGYTAIDPAGFNPFFGKIFYSQYSCLDELRTRIDLPLNADLFKYEVFYALHDFVHVWSLHGLARSGYDAKGSWERHEDVDPAWFQLLLLFSEAAATVVVDYWLLGVKALPTIPDTTSKFSTLTSPFSACRDIPQIEGNPYGVEINSPEFLVQLARAYCVGWSGPIGKLMKSFGDQCPCWLTREFYQSERQLRLCRQWLRTLKGDGFDGISVSQEYFESLQPNFLNIATDLRDWVDNGHINPTIISPNIGKWCGAPPAWPDFRFLNALQWYELGGALSDDSFERLDHEYLNAQMVSRIRPCQLVGLKKELRAKTLSEVPSSQLHAAIEGLPKLIGGNDGPLNLFFVS